MEVEMKPVEFKGTNCIFAKNQPEYLNLPVYKSPGGIVTSCWKLNLWEWIQILFKGRIYFTVLTFNQPLQPQKPSLTFGGNNGKR